MTRARSITLGLLLALAATGTEAAEPAGAAIPRSVGTPYAPRNLPDRIVLTPGADPSREMAVAFRTDRAQATAEAQIAVAVDGPTLSEKAVAATGTTRSIDSANGPANYHQIRFAGLIPDTVYAYRLKGAAGWGEWHQFRTAASDFRPFRFLYLGDTQNGILTYAARVIRQAFSHGDIALVTHAGDLVAQRDDLDHDDEWGEWNAAGGYNYARVPQLPATGNHDMSTASCRAARRAVSSPPIGHCSSPCPTMASRQPRRRPIMSTIRAFASSSSMVPRRSTWAPTRRRPNGSTRC